MKLAKYKENEEYLIYEHFQKNRLGVKVKQYRIVPLCYPQGQEMVQWEREWTQTDQYQSLDSKLSLGMLMTKFFYTYGYEYTDQ